MSGEIDAPRVRLELTSRPEAARLVRSMSTAAGEVLGFDSELLSDVNTAVSEACNNVIQHAYGNDPGPFSVEFALTPGGLEVHIRDHGRGIRESAPDHDGLKVGLALMSAVADRAEFIRVPEGGTEVRLCFRGAAGAGRAASPASHHAGDRAEVWGARLPTGLSGDIVLTVSPVDLLAPVLGRIGRALAPSAGFSLDRCADVYLVTDALGAHAQKAAETASISVALGAHDERLEFAVAPLRTGTNRRLDRGNPGALASLADELTVIDVGGHQTLRVAMRDHQRSRRENPGPHTTAGS
ncbi:MAG TPA: ATP-binding protein [Solirubrobacteraceae bacterium]|nr:ATP-binding protein [Solirubrobacteraceae bacterium]